MFFTLKVFFCPSTSSTFSVCADYSSQRFKLCGHKLLISDMHPKYTNDSWPCNTKRAEHERGTCTSQKTRQRERQKLSLVPGWVNIVRFSTHWRGTLRAAVPAFFSFTPIYLSIYLPVWEVRKVHEREPSVVRKMPPAPCFVKTVLKYVSCEFDKFKGLFWPYARIFPFAAQE